MAGSRERACALIDEDLARLRSEFGGHIISEDGSDLPQVLAQLLMARRLTIATAEIGTGGLLAARLNEASDDLKWFARGLVLPPSAMAERSVAGLPRAALHLSTLAREEANADIGLGIGEIILKDHQKRNAYVEVCIGVDIGGKTGYRTLNFRAKRARAWAADAALALLRESLLGKFPVDQFKRDSSD